MLVAHIIVCHQIATRTTNSRMGHTIGQKGPIAIRMAKECVNAADEMSLEQGLLFERRNFHALFATQDQKEVSGLMFYTCV